MDAVTLDHLLDDSRERQFWLKPIGYPRDHPDWDSFESRRWTENQIEIHFAKSPAKVAVGAILIAYRINVSALIYVAERLPVSEWTGAEYRSQYSRERFPYYIKSRNLTPQFGNVWRQHCIQPFVLAKEHNTRDPGEPVQLGGIQRGNDKASIPRGFAELLIKAIRDAE